MSDYKLEDWIEPYKSENGLEYHIPDYKIRRLMGIQDKLTQANNRIDVLEQDNKILKEFVRACKDVYGHGEGCICSICLHKCIGKELTEQALAKSEELKGEN